jgi:enoyl-CoA hydratase
MTESHLLTSESEGLLTFTFNRPDVRNALTRSMRETFATRLLDADQDSTITAIVVTGTDPAFTGGVDIKEFGSNPLTPHDRRYRINPVKAILATRKPIICAVNGPCVSGGLEIALACDFIVASDRATFADTHARLGLVPGWGLTAMLPRSVGVARAKEMSITGKAIDAGTALMAGLVNHVVDHQNLMEFAASIAIDIAKSNPQSVRTCLDLYDRGSGSSLSEAFAFEADAVADRRTDPSEVERLGSVAKRRG